MTSKLTRERLQEIAEDGFLKHGESKELARMALAAMDSEPVAFTEKHEISNMHATGIYLRAWPADRARNAVEGYTIPLYLHAQPAPVVPEEATPDSIEILASARRRDHAVFQWDEDQRNAAADSWNAFRAAMLQELKKVQELKRSAGVTKMCRCCTPNLRRNPIAARRKTSSFQRKAQSITVIYQSANAQGVRLLPESAQKWPSTLW